MQGSKYSLDFSQIDSQKYCLARYTPGSVDDDQNIGRFWSRRSLQYTGASSGIMSCIAGRLLCDTYLSSRELLKEKQMLDYHWV